MLSAASSLSTWGYSLFISTPAIFETDCSIGIDPLLRALPNSLSLFDSSPMAAIAFSISSLFASTFSLISLLAFFICALSIPWTFFWSVGHFPSRYALSITCPISISCSARLSSRWLFFVLN